MTMNEQYFPNSFRRKLLNGDTVIGCWCSLGNAVATEVLGLAGFDWLLLDSEHAPNDVISLIPQLMALKDSSSAPVVRPPKNDPVDIKRMLDIGFYNLLIPHVETAEEAAAAVAATRYPPQGIRGVSVSHRSNGYGTVHGYFDKINENICVIVQVESGASVENAEKIAAIEGVDCLFVGPNDLAAELGHLGNSNHPDVQRAIRGVFECAKRHGKAAGILATAEADARRYMEWGATFVAVGSDLSVFRNATQALRDKFA